LETQEIGHLEHYNLKERLNTRLRYFFFLAIFFFASVSFAQNYPDRIVDSLLNYGIDNLINQNYGGAEKDFLKLNTTYPDIPLGKIYLAALEIAKCYDLGEEFSSESIIKKLKEAEEESETLIAKNPENVWYIYFLALSEGYAAYHEALSGEILSAISSGYNSIKNFERCLNLDSNFFEAYTAIGVFKYWKSRKTEFLDWLPFVKNEKDTGISYLESAIKYSSYNKYLAIYSLIWIYIDEGDYHKAIKVAEDALKIYPESRIFKWGLARANEEIDKKKAIEYYYEILSSYPDLKNSNHYNEIVLKHIIAQQYQKLGENKSALSLCNEILKLNTLSVYVKDKLSDRLGRVKQMQKELSRLK